MLPKTIRKADDAVMIAKGLQQQQLLGQLSRKNMNGTLGIPGDEGAGPVSVQLGDNVTNEYVTKPAKRKSYWVELVIIVAAVLGAGWLSSGGFASDPPELLPPVEIPADSDTLFELHLGETHVNSDASP